MKHIQKSLQPEELESSDNSGNASVVTQPALESAIVSVAERLNYGIDWVEKIPASLSVWKWEVKQSKFDLLPKMARDKFEARIAERQEVCVSFPGLIYNHSSRTRRKINSALSLMLFPSRKKSNVSNQGENRGMTERSET